MSKTSQQTSTTSEAELSALLELLACPVCADDKTPPLVDGEVLVCPGCGTSFPLYKSGRARIPWLFRDPGAMSLEWKARLNGFLHLNASEQKRLKRALVNPQIGDIARRRIRKVLLGTENQQDQVLDLVAPLELERLSFNSTEAATLLRSKLPKAQGLTGYYSNIFRDWAWNNGENEALFQVTDDLLRTHEQRQLGRFLTLGAGACRLSYDFHRRHSPDLSVVVDINPLLLFLASRVIGGESVPLFEFPIAPLNIDSFAVNQECRAPETLNAVDEGRFVFALADALNPPFKSGSFDTVLTPWLIDVIPQNLSEFIPTMNRLLRAGGVWLNTGSLAFFHGDEDWRYSEEEVLALLESNGFEVLASTRTSLPYLKSPASAHGRMETVFSFSARKIKNISAPVHYEYLPEWVIDTQQCVPSLAEFVVASSSHLLQAQVLAAIDGKRSISEIASLVAKQYGLQIPEASAAVKRIIVETYETNVTQRMGVLPGQN